MIIAVGIRARTPIKGKHCWKAIQMSRSGFYTTRPPYLASDSEESGVGRVNEQSHLPCGDPPLCSGGCDPRAPCEIRLVTKTLIKAQLFYSQMLLYSVRPGVAPIVISYLSLDFSIRIEWFCSSVGTACWQQKHDIYSTFLFNFIDFYTQIDF